MATHVGIELSPDACRIVELDGGPIESGRTPTTRVCAYAILPPTGPEADGHFATLARRTVAVVVWGARAEHRQMFVANGSYERMRSEALAAARTDGLDTQGTLADFTPASTAIKDANRQPVVLVLARGQEISAALAPIVAARARIRSVITPAEALLGLARSRQAFSIPGGIEAYVAMDRTVTCLALVRDGSLLGARELTWGYENASSAAAVSSAAGEARRDDLAARLIDELAQQLSTVGEGHGTLTQVAICGGLPELRTMTVTLMERLDVEVETLDSLFGIDTDHLPDQADDLRDQVSELRLAWATAADRNGPLNLMRHRHRRNRRAVLARVAVVGGVAAGLGVGWAVQGSQWWESTAPGTIARATPPAALPAQRPQAPRTAAPSSPPQPTPPVIPPPVIERPAPSLTETRTVPAPAVVPPAAAPPAPARSAPPPPPAPPAPERLPSVLLTQPSAAPPALAAPRPAPSQSLPARAPAPATVPVPVPATPPRSTVPTPAPPPVVTAPPPQRPAGLTPGPSTTAPALTPRVSASPVFPTPPPAPPAAPPLAPARPSPAAPSTPAVLAPASQKPAPSPPAPARAPAVQERAPQPSGPGSPTPAARPAVAPIRRPEPPPIPFDAVLGTILFSPDRKLAIVNGRIVGIGDDVNGARITEITPTTVLLRDLQGRMRILTLGQGTQTPAVR